MQSFPRSILALGLVGAALAPSAHAQGEVRQACVSASGLARIVPMGTACQAGEQALNWTAAGPQGPRGASGAPGPAGVAGAPGSPGAAGVRGPAGSTGPRGPAGLTGATGATGPTGAQGATGAAGPVGDTGSPGVAGPAGATGPAGPQGLPGAAGPTGATGLPGPTTVGATGARGATGPQGLPGQPGPQGPAGSQTTFGTNTNWAVDGYGGGTCVIGSVGLVAGRVVPGMVANGRLLSIAENPALFAVLGTSYGGDGMHTFALPDLRLRAPNGLSYWICVEGIFPSRL